MQLIYYSLLQFFYMFLRTCMTEHDVGPHILFMVVFIEYHSSCYDQFSPYDKFDAESIYWPQTTLTVKLIRFNW